jgi:amidase
MTRDGARRSAFVPHDLVAPIRGRAHGPLAGLTVAVKDMYDIAGQRAGVGSPEWREHQRPAASTAHAVQRLLDAGAEVIGKTVCDEFVFSLVGVNAHYGMPVNPRAPGRVPGGSSSGSAAATAAGACDIGLGSDTGGSIRVPASFCGIYAIRPTHGRVDARGAFAMAPSFDTVGWMAAAPGLLRLAGGVLLQGEAARLSVERLLIAQDCLAQADAEVAAVLRRFLERALPLLPASDETVVAPAGFGPWREAFRVIQGRELWALHGDFVTTRKPNFGPGIRERMAYAAALSGTQENAARGAMHEGRAAIRNLLRPGSVLALPTAPSIAPSVQATEQELDHFRTRAMALTCIAGISGLPQVTIPAGTASGCPVGLSFIGWAGGDEALLDLAVALAPCCGE